MVIKHFKASALVEEVLFFFKHTAQVTEKPIPLGWSGTQ